MYGGFGASKKPLANEVTADEWMQCSLQSGSKSSWSHSLKQFSKREVVPLAMTSASLKETPWIHRESGEECWPWTESLCVCCLPSAAYLFESADGTSTCICITHQWRRWPWGWWCHLGGGESRIPPSQPPLCVPRCCRPAGERPAWMMRGKTQTQRH